MDSRQAATILANIKAATPAQAEALTLAIAALGAHPTEVRHMVVPLYLFEEQELGTLAEKARGCMDTIHATELTHVIDTVAAELQQRATPMMVRDTTSTRH